MGKWEEASCRQGKQLSDGSLKDGLASRVAQNAEAGGERCCRGLANTQGEGLGLLLLEHRYNVLYRITHCTIGLLEVTQSFLIRLDRQ